MDKDKRKGWLRELKEGDKICISIGGYLYKDRYKFDKIKRITPTGIIKTSHQIFTPSGIQKTTGRFVSADEIVQYTLQIKQVIERTLLENKLKNMQMEDLSLNQLRRINAIVEEG